MSDFERLHPMMIIQRSFQLMRSFSFVLFILLGTFWNNWTRLLLGVVVLCVCCGLLAGYEWFFFKYLIATDRLIITKGWLAKKQIEVPYQRIQTIHRQTLFFLKPFKISSLIIETAGAGGGNETLLAVKERVYLQLQQHRQAKQVGAKAKLVTEVEPQYQITAAAIWKFTFTDGGIFAMLFAALTLIDQVKTYLPNGLLDHEWKKVLNYGITAILCLLGIFMVLLMTVTLLKNLLRYYHFEVWREGDNLIVRRGFFSRDTLTVPLHRIQALQFRQTLLRRLLHLTSVELILAAGKNTGEDEGINDDTFYLLPIIADQRVFPLLQQLMPEWKLVSPRLIDLKPANRLYFLRFPGLFCGALIIVGAWINIYLAIGAVGLTALVLGYLWWAAGYQQAGKINSKLLTYRTVQAANIVTLITPTNKIQQTSIHTGYWLYSTGIGHFSLEIKAGQSARKVKLKYLDLTSCHYLAQLSRLKSTI
ncbi:MAG: PH domain-containing protein [Liquorilactobacillus nagelii]|uniref:PH domain-containing protein n=1 Tax=Liquorilactobacillus nagelii TaxID=82688 RepID=UPI0039E8EE4C